MSFVLRLVPVLFVAASLQAADWPCWRGPTGGGSQPGYAGKLIDDPQQMKPVWKSEWVPDSTDGGYSSPVVADGKVFLYYYVGDRKQRDEEAYGKLRQGREWETEEQREQLSSPAADEVILCLDAASGKTLWKFVSPSTGLNQQGSNKVGGHFTPCYADGKVLVHGCTGIAFCVDAATGKEAWRAEVGFGNLRQLRDTCVADGKMPPFSRARGFMPCGAPCVAEGVAVFSDHGGHVGLDLATGKQLWRVAGSCNWDASPIAWSHGGRTYVLGVGNCIDPKTGKELWQIPAKHSSGTPALGDDIVVFSGGSGPKGHEGYGASAWAITPQGGTKLWECQPRERVCGNHTGPGIHDGVAYLHCPHAGPKGKDDGYVLAVDARTGERLAKYDGTWYVKLTPSVVGIGDRVMIVQCNNEFRLWGTGKDFKELGTRRKMDEYANSTTVALTDGLMYFHGRDAVYCFDLRAR